MENVLLTVAHELRIARSLAAKDATLGTEIDLTTEGDFAQKPVANAANAYLGAFDVNRSSISAQIVNGIAFSFFGTGGANKGFKWRLYAYRSSNGPIHQVAEGTGLLGTQGVIKFPHNGATAPTALWADTLTVTWYNWYKEVKPTDETGNNTQAEIWLDACGYRWWYIEIDDPDAGDAATTIGAYYGYF